MSAKYNSLEELRRKKALLKQEVTEMEDLLTFDNTKESLSAFTNGFTDQFIKQEKNPDGTDKISLDTSHIIKQISNNVTDKVLNRSSVVNFAKSDAGNNVMSNALKIGAVSFIGNYARKNMKNSDWRKKIIGFALIYLAPIALRFIRTKLEDYQRKKTTQSLEQLI